MKWWSLENALSCREILQLEETETLAAGWARLALAVYALVLTIRGTATLQVVLLIFALLCLGWERRRTLGDAWLEARWILGSLMVFSIWIFVICGFWREPPLRSWDPGGWEVSQPWFGLDLWRRDIAQPMLAMVAGYWAFRGIPQKWRLWNIQSLWLMVLGVICVGQFFWGEIKLSEFREVTTPILHKGTLHVRGFSRDNIFFSYVLVLMLPAVCAFLFRDGLRSRSLWRWLVFVIFLYLVFLNKRRGAWFALLVMGGVWLLGQKRRTIMIALLGALVMGVVIYQHRPEWFIRSYDTREIGRVEILHRLPELLKENPWVGVGFGKECVVKNYWWKIHQHAHNSFLNLALEVGFPGLLLWLGVLGYYLRRFWLNRNGPEGWVSRLGFCLIIGFCTRNMTDDIWLSSNAELFWLTVGVLMPSCPRVSSHA